jgi:hypothetical protein
MPTVMLMRWPGVTLDQYDEARAKVRWEEDTPPGAIFHAAGRDGDALRVFDVWESPRHFQAFVEERLMPGVREIGIEGDSEARFYDLHRVFAPDGVPAGAGTFG